MISRVNNWYDDATGMEIVETASDSVPNPTRYLSSGEIRFKDKVIGKTAFTLIDKSLFGGTFTIDEEYRNQGFFNRYVEYLCSLGKDLGYNELRGDVDPVTAEIMIHLGWEKIKDVNENIVSLRKPV